MFINVGNVVARVALACTGGAIVAGCVSSGGPAPDAVVTGTVVVLNKAAASASLVDAATGASYATLPTGAGPHEVAVSPDGRTAVVADYGEGAAPGRTLTVLDLAERRVVRTIDLGDYRRPHGIAYFPDGRRVAVTVEANRAVIVVDVVAGTVERAVATDQPGSHMLALAADGSRAYVANLGAGTITALDLARGVADRTVHSGAGAEGIDVTPDGREVWVTNREANTVVVFDAASMVPLDTLPSADFPIRVKITPDGRTALVSNARSGSLRLFDVASRRETGTIAMPVEPGTGRGTMLGANDSSGVPIGILISPDGRRAWVANANADVVTVVDIPGRRVLGYARAGREPDGLGYSPITP